MKGLSRAITSLFVFLAIGAGSASANNTANQTDDLSPILPETGLPFKVIIEEANFQLPTGFHSGLFAQYKGLWVFIAGSTIGLHGFDADPFPPEGQNRSVFVVNPSTGTVVSRSLTDPSSGLNQQQIDSLSAISPQGYQENHTLYMSGGYGIDTATGTFGTKPVFTAIDLPGLVQWVTEPANKSHSVIKNIRQIYNPIFQIAGGEMYQVGNFIQLVFGQNFTGVYDPGTSGDYSEQVRRFKISEIGGQLIVDTYRSVPFNPDPVFRRRDLNILPTLLNKNNRLQYGLVAYAGVFTPQSGVWTVPVVIDDKGTPTMAAPDLPTTFKQAMNHYVCASASLYSRKYESMFHVFFGGMSYGYYSGGVFETDAEIPFINQVTTTKMDKNGYFTQYLMDGQYPEILSTQVNPGNPLLFGAGAYFIPNNILQYPNGIISLDSIRQASVIGYIVGGIQSTVPNTSVIIDSSASPHVFKVILVPTSSNML